VKAILLASLDWIIILFVIYLDAFRVEKIGGISLQGHFSGKSQLGKLGSETFQSHFEALNDVFWGSGVENSIHTLNGVLHSETFPTVQTMRQSELVCKSYASHKLTYLVDHHGTKGCHVSSHTHAYGASQVRSQVTP
jgi:hypothetical protein